MRLDLVIVVCVSDVLCFGWITMQMFRYCPPTPVVPEKDEVVKLDFGAVFGREGEMHVPLGSTSGIGGSTCPLHSVCLCHSQAGACSFAKRRISAALSGQSTTSTDQLKYQKMCQFATCEGEWCEEGSLAFLFLRCLREGLQFALSSNDCAGGKLENLIPYWNSGAVTECPQCFANRTIRRQGRSQLFPDPV
ncbi:uncharacterized protein LOC126106708 [Schistocerca cancellata]|uniref:uncharacterized protein LOC126106708 n=1 Tax=Schistocerca cancellata TaxID=274614 RepID=UPI0021199D17|nr:uncharacterized protein LOC126106708 [Schistocerca cancellata]